MSDDRAMMKELARQKADYQRETSIIEDQVAAVARLEESENTSLTELKTALEKEVILLANIHREKEFYEVAVEELQSASDNLKNTISNLNNNSKKNNMLQSAGFGKSKGKLPMPCKGKILKKVRRKVKRSMGKQRGIYIDGSFGTEVKAVHQGIVEYSGILKGYGQVIVINHGERYFTVSAYLSERKKSEGDTVLAGDTIGYVGEAGLTTGPALYFEIRKGEENLNPLKWLRVN
jgi:murein hydrolase activator